MDLPTLLTLLIDWLALVDAATTTGAAAPALVGGDLLWSFVEEWPG